MYLGDGDKAVERWISYSFPSTSFHRYVGDKKRKNIPIYMFIFR
jgi:hypothetical protein